MHPRETPMMRCWHSWPQHTRARSCSALALPPRPPPQIPPRATGQAQAPLQLAGSVEIAASQAGVVGACLWPRVAAAVAAAAVAAVTAAVAAVQAAAAG